MGTGTKLVAPHDGGAHNVVVMAVICVNADY
jgi:hypothetical protein